MMSSKHVWFFSSRVSCSSRHFIFFRNFLTCCIILVGRVITTIYLIFIVLDNYS
jgi:hypothetical protein